MNEGMMTLGDAIETLRELFPNLNEEIILSALIQNQNNYEATLDALLFFNTNENIQTKEKEISLFENKNITPYYQDQTGAKKSDNFYQSEQFKDSHQSNKNEIFRNSNVTNKIEVELIKPVIKTEEKLEKKSFGQKFKCIC